MFAPKVAKPQTKAAASSTNKLVPQHSALATRPFGGGTVEQAHFLQRTIGNQATLRLLAQRTSKPAGDQLDDAPAQEHDGSAALGLSWDFSKIQCFRPTDRTDLGHHPWSRHLRFRETYSRSSQSEMSMIRLSVRRIALPIK